MTKYSKNFGLAALLAAGCVLGTGSVVMAQSTPPKPPVSTGTGTNVTAVGTGDSQRKNDMGHSKMKSSSKKKTTMHSKKSMGMKKMGMKKSTMSH